MHLRMPFLMLWKIPGPLAPRSRRAYSSRRDITASFSCTRATAVRLDQPQHLQNVQVIFPHKCDNNNHNIFLRTRRTILSPQAFVDSKRHGNSAAATCNLTINMSAFTFPSHTYTCKRTLRAPVSASRSLHTASRQSRLRMATHQHTSARARPAYRQPSSSSSSSGTSGLHIVRCARERRSTRRRRKAPWRRHRVHITPPRARLQHQSNGAPAVAITRSTACEGQRRCERPAPTHFGYPPAVNQHRSAQQHKRV
jgi:hypothetical protein